MEIYKKELLLQYAKEFRDAIEKVIDNKLCDEDFFIYYPKNQCGSATDLLGQYYLDKGIKTWYVCGINDLNESHAWLTTRDSKKMNDYLIIDITSDQFGSKYPKVYVGRANEFYNSYDIDFSRDSCNVNEIQGTIDYKKLYDIICRYIVR